MALQYFTNHHHKVRIPTGKKYAISVALKGYFYDVTGTHIGTNIRKKRLKTIRFFISTIEKKYFCEFSGPPRFQGL